jgi:protein-S-isoprenylcysteine O-methyltransferase Ste14
MLFVVALALGWLLHRIYPLPLLGAGARATEVVLGWSAILVWAVLMVWAVVSFRRARTAIIPNRPATMLVLGGPYRFTRNPMYLAFVVFYLGAGLLINSIWTLLLLPLVLVVLYVTVIRREERYLAATFGASYDAYRKQVRRWL